MLLEDEGIAHICFGGLAAHATMAVAHAPQAVDAIRGVLDPQSILLLGLDRCGAT